MWLTDGRRSLLLQGERIARVEAGKRGLFVEVLPGRPRPPPLLGGGLAGYGPFRA
ncbi:MULTISPECIES: hypothetical protein [Thermus]|uniref:hypothetical protein n=1 Tax=Thermus TaxID=270 RepID=UPI0002E89E79|nr:MULTISPECIES: hypothetical protein [Thermus]QZY59034.1 hypothetical protein K7H19_02745 [Thermus thermophilus]WMV95566.1 hypothetical protein RB649_00820 [Thermus thermophilus HB27]